MRHSRPCKHVRRVHTRHGTKRKLINPHINKRMKKRAMAKWDNDYEREKIRRKLLNERILSIGAEERMALRLLREDNIDKLKATRVGDALRLGSAVGYRQALSDVGLDINRDKKRIPKDYDLLERIAYSNKRSNRR